MPYSLVGVFHGATDSSWDTFPAVRAYYIAIIVHMLAALVSIDIELRHCVLSCLGLMKVVVSVKAVLSEHKPNGRS